MYKLPKPDNNTIKIGIIVLSLLFGICCAKLYQPRKHTIRIYEQALKDYKNKNYSNAYYLFSKISRFSKLKPAALYRQALCANALGDEKSELLAYQNLFRHYPANKLSSEAMYKAGQILISENPKQALKYFKEISRNTSNQEYKTASDYYIAKISVQKARNVDKESEIAFKNYLEKYPDGRLAVEVSNTWLKYSKNMTSYDIVLAGKAYYTANLNKKAESILSKANLKESWALRALNFYKLYKDSDARYLVNIGVSQFGSNANIEDYEKAVTSYVKKDANPYLASSYLFNIANGKNKDFIWSLKCRYSPSSQKEGCYSQLYANYPDGNSSQDVMMNLILLRVINKDFEGAKSVADEFVTKFPESDKAPMVMFWRAKIEQQYSHNPNYGMFYKNIINNYPDTYYAYRSFWILQDFKNGVIDTDFEYKPVEYPYQYPTRANILYSLLLVRDYDMIKKYTNDDFIKSWAEYKKGNYSLSIHLAQNAMNKMKNKPPKNDVRWRLVYPMNFYKQIKSNAQLFNNNEALIMAIIKEESCFNPDSQSGAGAIGLMQLMPVTAHDVGIKNGYHFKTTDLLNPELNIRIGNLYYATLKNLLNGMDVSAIASYNGGIGAVKRWKNNIQYSDTDEFVEQIPYDETKEYVKKVFKSYWNYTRIYQK
ncbi:transglycosylase SLT domain-containing protein [bacterium]|nr:transglycosylase SLT domain-containing protein [bacterium]